MGSLPPTDQSYDLERAEPRGKGSWKERFGTRSYFLTLMPPILSKLFEHCILCFCFKKSKPAYKLLRNIRWISGSFKSFSRKYEWKEKSMNLGLFPMNWCFGTTSCLLPCRSSCQTLSQFFMKSLPGSSTSICLMWFQNKNLTGDKERQAIRVRGTYFPMLWISLPTPLCFPQVTLSQISVVPN